MAELIRSREPVGLAKLGERELVAFSFDWSRYGTPATPNVELEIESTGEDKTDLLTGSATISGQSVITPKVGPVSRGVRYRLSCQVTIDGDATGSTYEAYAFIDGDR